MIYLTCMHTSFINHRIETACLERQGAHWITRAKFENPGKKNQSFIGKKSGGQLCDGMFRNDG